MRSSSHAEVALSATGTVVGIGLLVLPGGAAFAGGSTYEYSGVWEGHAAVATARICFPVVDLRMRERRLRIDR